MEREKELPKLINVLRQTSRMARQSEWTGGAQDTAAFCVDQYNRVLARFKELDPTVSAVFEPLPQGSSLSVVAVACRQLAAYYEDEFGAARGFGRGYGFGFDPKVFKEFWEKSASEIEDLGEFIRESIEEWTRQRKKQKPAPPKNQ
ncbi:MAG TPA: hypothetical protein VJ124_17035 [Pyrinomonadaceae bacterium]|nr:hypothetical protein [Pyrinomonadaceae bacterium]